MNFFFTIIKAFNLSMAPVFLFADLPQEEHTIWREMVDEYVRILGLRSEYDVMPWDWEDFGAPVVPDAVPAAVVPAAPAVVVPDVAPVNAAVVVPDVVRANMWSWLAVILAMLLALWMTVN